ncbi:unnamed protein product [Darwinula stevensoni]|uniref:AIG1-type G domain-containing protein n=1 Tax=Darwinula stevensoni TaxID=69355 RepID=A0A7R8X0A8_9CRUS|nr:unnamed protein product [Darwinula stevensoni]CAG0881497.1 unnamed protein product [Darwinula stevensoni]
MEEVKMQEYNLYWEMRMKKVIMFGKNGLWEEARRAFNIPQEQGIDIQVKDPKSGERILVRAPKDVPDGPAKLDWTTSGSPDEAAFNSISDEESDFGKSQTKGITAYTIHPTVCSTDFPYALTIIDTPGFGDTEGIGADQDTIQKVKAFFSKDGVEGLDCVHAIGMVIKASANRVTAPQEYVLQTILSLFGNDVGLIFHFLITFADGTTPPVLRIIENKNLPVSKTHHLFNCGALYVNNRDDASGVSKLFWDLATNGIDEFLIFLQDSKPVSLRLTKDVLCERERMDDLVQKLMLQVRKGLEGLEAIRHEYKNTKRNRRKHLKKPLEILARDFAKKQVEVMCLISQAHECQQRLDKIALRPDPLSLVKYVDMLIMVEVNSSDSNSDQRVKALRQVREGAQWMSDIREKGKQFRPFEETLKSLEDEGLKVKIGNQDSDACELEFLDSKRGFLQTLKNFFFGGGGRD